MILIIDYGLCNMKYSLWHEDKLLKVSIRERNDKTNFALEKLLSKTYAEYKEFAANYSGCKPSINPIEKVLVIASKHPEHTKAKTFNIEFVKDDMSSDIKATVKEKVTTETSVAQIQDTNGKKKNSAQKLNVYNYTEQIIDNEFNYTQNILGVACNTDYLYKLTVALHLAGIENYMIIDPTQVLSQLAETTETTLIVDIAYNTYFLIVTTEVMENGVVVRNIVKTNGVIKNGTRSFDAALLEKGHTLESIWNEKYSNTYSDLSSIVNITYNEIIRDINEEIENFTNNERKTVNNIVITGGGSNQEGLKEYILENIKGIKPLNVDGTVNNNPTYRLKVVEPFEKDVFSKLPAQVKSYLYPSFAAYKLYISKSNPIKENEYQKGKLIDYLDTDGNFIKIFKNIRSLKTLTKFAIPISVVLLVLTFSIVGQWFVYKNLSTVLGDRASSVSSEKTTVNSKLQEVQTELTTIESDMLSETYDWSKVLNGIAISTPRGVQISEIKTGTSGDTNTVFIIGFSDSRFKIADMSTLLKNSIFTEAEIQTIDSTETIVKQPIQKFTIKCSGKR